MNTLSEIFILAMASLILDPNLSAKGPFLQECKMVRKAKAGHEVKRKDIAGSHQHSKLAHEFLVAI